MSTAMYLRFVVAGEKDDRFGFEQGLFTALYRLQDRGELAAHELAWFQDAETWFNRNLSRPSRLTWSTRPGAPKRAICWLKATAVEHVRRMRELVALLEDRSIIVRELRTERPGYIVFEDDYQVAAVPFAEKLP